MPRHGCGIEYITFFGNELPGVLKLSFDVTHLHDPPLRRSGVHVAKDRVRIECAWRRSSAAAPSAAPATSPTAACIERIVGLCEPIKRVGKQMVFIHLGASLVTFGRSHKQVPVNLVRWRVGCWSVIECDFHHFCSRCRWWRRGGGGVDGLVVVGVDFHPKSVLRAANLI